MSETNSDVSVFNVYKGTMRSFKFVFPNGVEAVFRPDFQAEHGSVYYTDDPQQIEWIEQEIKARHPNIYKDPKQLTIRSDMTSQEAQLRAQIRAEIENEFKNNMSAPNPTYRESSSYIPPVLQPGNSTTTNFDEEQRVIASGIKEPAAQETAEQLNKLDEKKEDPAQKTLGSFPMLNVKK